MKSKDAIHFQGWKPYPMADKPMLHKWAKELARTSARSYSEATSLLETLWLKSDEQLLIESVLYGRIE